MKNDGECGRKVRVGICRTPFAIEISWLACVAAGVPGRYLHDFRRTAVRNLERAGVPRSTAMSIVGHQTQSIYTRYAIQDETMQQEAARKLDAWANTRAGHKLKIS